MSHLFAIWCRHDIEGQSAADTLRQLEALGIHGAFQPNGDYFGYAYDNQCWVEEPAQD